jgi:hypothetical protein
MKVGSRQALTTVFAVGFGLLNRLVNQPRQILMIDPCNIYMFRPSKHHAAIKPSKQTFVPAQQQCHMMPHAAHKILRPGHAAAFWWTIRWHREAMMTL